MVTKMALAGTSLLFFIFLLFPSVVFANKFLLKEDFDNVPNGEMPANWDYYGLSGWEVIDRKYGIRLNSGISNSFPSDTLWNYDWKNIIYEVDLLGVDGVDKNILLKYKNPNNFIEVHYNGDKIYLAKYIDPGGTLSYFYTVDRKLDNNTPYHFRIEINGNNIRVFLDNSLLFDILDTEPIFEFWKVGLRVGTGAVSPTEVWFDNILVTNNPQALPYLDVPYMAQVNPLWAYAIYDSATEWSSTPYISRWGCALTSAAMVLKYYGHKSDPLVLNDWLKSQSDGYLRNGLLNWLAVSRYTKLNSNPSSPTLEYRQQNSSQSNLISELTAGRPAILKEPGHYIVAKSHLSDTFGINDPAFPDRLTLRSYGNTFSSLGSFRSTQSDLSYILLVVNPNVDLKIFAPGGPEIAGFTYIDDPLIDDIDNITPSGGSLKIFQYPVPEVGIYNVQLQGSLANYVFDSYLYSKDGTVNLSSFKGFIGTGHKDEFKIVVGKTQEIMQVITINTIIADLEDARKLKLVKNHGLYTTINVHLMLAKKFIKMGRPRLAKSNLEATLHLIKIATPKFIDPLASEILQTNLQILINSL